MKNRWRTEQEEKGTLIYYVALCADKLTQNSRGRTIVSEDRLNSSAFVLPELARTSSYILLSSGRQMRQFKHGQSTSIGGN